CKIRASCKRERHSIRGATLRSEIEITGEKEARSMLRSLIAWSLGNPLIAPLCVPALVSVGNHSFLNVEAYPDSASAITDVVAEHSEMSAEEDELQVTGSLKVALAEMPGLKYARSKSSAGLGVDLISTARKCKFRRPSPQDLKHQTTDGDSLACIY